MIEVAKGLLCEATGEQVTVPEAGIPACSHCGCKYRDGVPVRYFFGPDFLHGECVGPWIHAGGVARAPADDLCAGGEECT
jgi:hypothetical protein